jgi:pimeloyl-ACP methyl ester carboxylesterase
VEVWQLSLRPLAPEFVAAAILVDPPLYMDNSGLRDERLVFTRLMLGAGKPQEELVAAGFPPSQIASLSKLDPAVLLEMESFYNGWVNEDLLTKVRCPVLLEYGDRTPGATGFANSCLHESDVEGAKRLISNCTATQIKGSGHLPQIQQPEAFRQEFPNL